MWLHRVVEILFIEFILLKSNQCTSFQQSTFWNHFQYNHPFNGIWVQWDVTGWKKFLKPCYFRSNIKFPMLEPIKIPHPLELVNLLFHNMMCFWMFTIWTLHIAHFYTDKSFPKMYNLMGIWSNTSKVTNLMLRKVLNLFILIQNI